MAFRLNLTTRSSPDSVLAAIRSHAAYRRESEVPPELRRAGALGVEATIRGHRFSMRLTSHGDTPPSEHVLQGEVTRLLGGGSRVRARAATAANERLALVLPIGLAVWLALSGRWWIAAVVAAVGGALSWFRLRRARSADRDADAALRHLAERLEAAVRAADGDATGDGVRRGSPVA